VLLETSRFDADNQRSYLFVHPIETITAFYLDDIPDLFRRIEFALAQGHHVAGYLSYECGYHFERFAEPPLPRDLPLAWFGIYTRPFVFNHSTGNFEGPAPQLIETGAPDAIPTAFAANADLTIGEDEYTAKIARIKSYIEAGDTYQVNFTDAVTARSALAPAQAFAALSASQPVSYSALLHIGDTHILSLSPELFFRMEKHPAGDRITTRPMKGTMPRGLDLAEDDAQAARLQADEKNRSEHVMIVDLLRNDLGRICCSGSVVVEDIFSIERYRTLLQMTSTISGRLRPNLTFYEIFRALFPSGSITGAPKLRTMQIIRELERNPRGVYTGAIGHIAPSGDATFNVAIRTVVLRDGYAHMGVGGGIVADSDPVSEYRECQLKAAFLTRPHSGFQLIETMLFDGTTMPFLELHLDRLAASAQYFDFPFDRAAIESRIAALTASLPSTRHSIRLLLHATGDVALNHTALPEDAPTIAVRISAYRTQSSDPHLRHKTTNRDLYNSELARARAEGFDEVLFLNQRGELTEGAISTLFVRLHGQLLTPPLAAGVLPGVLRRHILVTDPTAREQTLALADLAAAEALYLGNSLRGLRQVTRLETGTLASAR
jgi:para-aminobenzoate synthetase/4-amino-4-deoxychorismate lyase